MSALAHAASPVTVTASGACKELAQDDLPWHGRVPDTGICLRAPLTEPNTIALVIEFGQDAALANASAACNDRAHFGVGADALPWHRDGVTVSSIGAYPGATVTLDVVTRSDPRWSVASALATLCQLPPGPIKANTASTGSALAAARRIAQQAAPSDLTSRLRAVLTRRAYHAGQTTDALRIAGVAEGNLDQPKTVGQRWLAINVSDVYASAGDYAAAQRHACRALTGKPACTTDSPGLGPELDGVAANRLGLLHHRRGELETAGHWYRNALERYGDTQSSRHAQVIGNLGGIASDQGRYRTAIEHYKTAVAALRGTPDTDQLTTTLNNLGAAYIRLGDYRLGMAALNEALTLADAHELADKAVNARMLLADLLRRLGRPLEARGYINEALASPASSGRQSGRAHVEVVNGRIWADLGDQAAAIAAFERALSIYQRLGRTWSVVSTQVSLARSLAAANDVNAAIAMTETAFASAAEHGFARHQGESLLAGGLAALNSGDPTRAGASLQAALAVVEDNLDLASAFELHVALARLASHRQQPEQILHHLHTAFELADNGAAELARADDRALFEATTEQARDLMLSTLLDSSGPEAALNFVLSRQDLDGFAQSALSSAGDELRDALAQAAAAARRNADPHEVASARQRAARVLLDLRQNTDDGQAVQSEPIRASEIAAALPADGVYLHYSTAEPNSHLWVIRASGIEHKLLPGRAALVRHLDALRDALNERRPLVAIRAALSDALLPALTSGERLFIAADGALAQVPLAMLGQQRFVIEDHALTFLPNVSLLRQRTTRAPADSPQALSAAVFTDPLFDARDARLDAAVVPQHEYRRGLDRLPFSSLEARTLASSDVSAQVWTGFDATRDNVLQALARAPDILHLATHGSVDDLLPEASGLTFSTLTPNGEPVDGLLTLIDLYRQPISSRLVVLSACDTAAGASLAGEGTLSLARAFLRQGADQVVATLWPVADQSSARLIDAFYQVQLTERLSASDALRQAQLVLLREPRTAHPYFWAGYTIAGIGQPLLAPTTR